MPRLNDETKTTEQSTPKRPNQNTDRRAVQMAEAQTQSTNAIAASSSAMVGKLPSLCNRSIPSFLSLKTTMLMQLHCGLLKFRNASTRRLLIGCSKLLKPIHSKPSRLL
jgi:hypothetical protein